MQCIHQVNSLSDATVAHGATRHEAGDVIYRETCKQLTQPKLMF